MFAPRAKPSAPRAEPRVVPRAKPRVVPRAKPSVAPRAEPSVAPRAKPRGGCICIGFLVSASLDEQFAKTSAPRAEPRSAPRAKPRSVPRAKPRVVPRAKPRGTYTHKILVSAPLDEQFKHEGNIL